MRRLILIDADEARPLNSNDEYIDICGSANGTVRLETVSGSVYELSWSWHHINVTRYGADKVLSCYNDVKVRIDLNNCLIVQDEHGAMLVTTTPVHVWSRGEL